MHLYKERASSNSHHHILQQSSDAAADKNLSCGPNCQNNIKIEHPYHAAILISKTFRYNMSRVVRPVQSGSGSEHDLLRRLDENVELAQNLFNNMLLRLTENWDKSSDLKSILEELSTEIENKGYANNQTGQVASRLNTLHAKCEQLLDDLELNRSFQSFRKLHKNAQPLIDNGLNPPDGIRDRDSWEACCGRMCTKDALAKLQEAVEWWDIEGLKLEHLQLGLNNSLHGMEANVKTLKEIKDGVSGLAAVRVSTSQTTCITQGHEYCPLTRCIVHPRR